MGSIQRADRFEQLFKALKKHYKPVAPISDRKVLDHLLYACCLQDASHEAADEAFAKLQQAYFDSNEIRVTTIAELSESLTSLPHAAAAASRVKKSLQSMFEGRYSFDIDDLKKSNLGKAVDEISGWQGVTKFVVSYVTQHAFGGHSIPVDESTLSVCQLLDLLTPVEAEKGTLPGIERAIPKNKGLEFGSLLHQFSVDHATNFKHPSVVAVFKELGMTSKAKAPPPPVPPKLPKAVVAAHPTTETKTPLKGTKAKPAIAAPPSASPSAKAAALASSQPKKSEPATSSKASEPKPAKGTGPAKSGRSAMGTTPSSDKPAGKTASGSAKPSTAAKKAQEPTSAKKSMAKQPAKPIPKTTAKAVAKKSETKKSAVKPKSHKPSASVPSKPPAKRSASGAKPAPKKLPVKPVTKKRTKPR